MKITQETNEFKPITIVLETREEVQEFWGSLTNPYNNALIKEIEAYLQEKLNAR